MEQRITLITLGVTDLNTSRSFYERLGWKRSVATAKGVAFFDAGAVVLALYPREDLARDLGIGVEQHGTCRASAWLKMYRAARMWIVCSKRRWPRARSS